MEKKQLVTNKALFTQEILAHNVAIKRYWDRKIFLNHGLPRTNQGKLLMKHKVPWFVVRQELTLANRSQCLKNIFLSQDCASKWLMRIRPKWETHSYHPLWHNQMLQQCVSWILTNDYFQVIFDHFWSENNFLTHFVVSKISSSLKPNFHN